MEKKSTKSRPSLIIDFMGAGDNSNTSLSGKDTHTATIRGNHQETCTQTTWSKAITSGAHCQIKGNQGQPLESSHPGTPLPAHSSFHLCSKSLVPHPFQIILPLRCWEHVRPQSQLLRHLPARQSEARQRCRRVPSLCHHSQRKRSHVPQHCPHHPRCPRRSPHRNPPRNHHRTCGHHQNSRSRLGG